MTERAYAKDLALVRDAYLGRDATAGTLLLADPTAMSPGDRLRLSAYSGNDDAFQTPLRTPSGGESSLNVPGYFSSASLNASSISIISVGQSALTSRRSSGIYGAGNLNPPSRTLAAADERLIFGNIHHLAAGAEEMAIAFESAMGSEDPGPGLTPRESERGADRLGKMFTSLVSTWQPPPTHLVEADTR